MPGPIIRTAELRDVEQASDLIVRLKRLNGEFDPMYKVSDDVLDAARKYLEEAIASDRSIVLLAQMNDKIVGIVKADLRDRRFYEPKIEGAIIDLYVLPEYRRRGLGEALLEHIMRRLREKGAEIVTAEFPAQNLIAVNFYEKMEFRRLVSIYASKFPEAPRVP